MIKQRHTKRRDRVLLRMRKGEILVGQTSQREDDRGSLVYWLEPSGKPVGPVTALKVIALQEVVSQNDGLFEGMSQTYRYRSPPDVGEV